MTPHEVELLAEIARLEKMGASWPILRRALAEFQNAVRQRHRAAQADRILSARAGVRIGPDSEMNPYG
ncbi:MAG: hypothetical protein H3C30_19070 [Candidatus Hydrogenedentes bacterium]|nr:hypothetical protein [Candidatus Hydrogenedentota bacterium]